MVLELLDQAIKIGVAGAEASREPVPAALGNHLAVREHLELTGLTRPKNGLNAQVTLDGGHETRDLYLVVLSRRAVNDFDLHSVRQSALQICYWREDSRAASVRLQHSPLKDRGLKTGRYNGTRTQRLPPIATIAADIEGSSQFILGLDAMR